MKRGGLLPPFDKSYKEPGSIMGYVRGVRENGVYLQHRGIRAEGDFELSF